MKSLVFLLMIISIPLVSHAQAIQTADIKFMHVDEDGARAMTSGHLAKILYSELKAEPQTITDDGVEKLMKNGKSYYCIKNPQSITSETICNLFFRRITSLPAESFVLTVRFDVDYGVLKGYALDPNINQMLLWNLTSGSIVL
ncbi:hypothetical protein B9G69_003180 [Bdellovibrio sp. SKB1291214]|uniref:hypothetical protein n=1 Tax=Bdellovibrio sp. SKB1291214 TaxID=1732569 RepID=UPI000B51E3D0|nr:hypothetical protein [Bdellovibrio sp. SKB1291214]UYL09574.1 hypothetical protein B9G69_003180 [Bdellovibrio sp. SKB1291214]